MRKASVGMLGFAVVGCLSPVFATASPFLYVANSLSSSVAVIDTETNAVVATIPVHEMPLPPVVSADGSRVYVQSADGTIAVVEARTASVLRTFDSPNPGSNGASSIALSPDGKRLYAIPYVTNSGIAVVDTKTGNVVDRMLAAAVPDDAPGLLASRDGLRLYVLYRQHRLLASVDTATGAVLGQLQLDGPIAESQLNGFESSRDGQTLYVSDSQNGLFSVDTSTMTLSSLTPLFMPAYGLSASHDGSRLFIGATDGACLLSMNLGPPLSSGSGTGAAGNSCNQVAVAPDGRHVYVSSSSSDSLDYAVNAFDTESMFPIAALTGFQYPEFTSQSMGPALTYPANGAWWNPAEPGRGFNIEVQGGTLVLTAMVYGADGTPTWLTSSGPYDATTATYTGTLDGSAHGQCLGCAFQPAAVQIDAGGPVKLVFSSATTGTLSFDGGSTPLEKYVWQ